MYITVRILLFIIILIYFTVFYQFLKKDRLLLRYSILWLFSGIVVLILDLFPGIMFVFSDLLGIEVASNGLFAVLIFLLITNLFTMTVTISNFSRRIKSLAQQLAILENTVREMKNDDNNAN